MVLQLHNLLYLGFEKLVQNLKTINPIKRIGKDKYLSGILGVKTMDDNLMYIPNDEIQFM